MTLGIIGAMEVEVAHLKRAMDVERTVTRARMEFCEGTIGRAHAVVVRGGVGKVNAGLCVQILVDVFGVTHLVDTGIAGSLDGRIGVGDIVVSTDARYHDVDATVFGYAPGEVPQVGTVAFPASPELRAAAVEAVRATVPDAGAFEGRVVSGDQFVGDPVRRAVLARDFGGLCCEMEGAAVAQASWLNGVPFVIIRAISDTADGSAKVLYPLFERRAAQRCAGIVEAMARRLPAS